MCYNNVGNTIALNNSIYSTYKGYSGPKLTVLSGVFVFSKGDVQLLVELETVVFLTLQPFARDIFSHRRGLTYYDDTHIFRLYIVF